MVLKLAAQGFLGKSRMIPGLICAVSDGLKRLASVVGLALVAGLVAPQGIAAAPDPRLERDLVAITNVDRTSNGLSALIEDGQLIEIARERSEDMIQRDYFSHEIPPTGERVFAIMDRRGVPFEVAGENLGWNTAGREATVQHVEKDFMNSPSHRSNILRDVFTTIGVGAVPAPDRIMYSVLFMKPFS